MCEEDRVFMAQRRAQVTPPLSTPSSHIYPSSLIVRYEHDPVLTIAYLIITLYNLTRS